MLRECDYSQALLEQVNQAISDKTPLVIQGSNSKAFLGRPVTGQTLDVRCHRGIVNYDPTELVITARAGRLEGLGITYKPMAFKAWSRSPMMSSGSSRPMLKRMKPLRNFSG